MRPGFLSEASPGGYFTPAVLSAVVLAVAAIVGLLFAPSLATKGGPGAENTEPALQLAFKDAAGSDLTLADFRGRAVLLNVWATWCGPCRKEMPALDRLQAKLGGADFEVITLSIDRGGLGVVERFFDEIGIANLAIYLDESAAAMSVLGITGIPTTLLIDREGREIRRWAGPAEWDSPEIEALIRSHVDLATSGTQSPSSNVKVKQWTALPAIRL
jgi:thiol-disulfide isomerase/thioredoxin